MSDSSATRPPATARWAVVATTMALGVAASLVGSSCTAVAQVGFQIVWVTIGEAATAQNKRATRVGRQLFLASDLLNMSLDKVKVARVDVEPVIVEVGVGEQLCLSALTMRAFGPDQKPIDGAPLSITIRQDHKERLRLNRSKRDICVKPADAGEYPVRVTSLLPAPDGTMRGAQVFLRARALADGAQSAETN